MQFQLVLQFHGDSLQDHDRMVVLEDELINVLGSSAKVDGHDVGSAETNIFILTSDPAATFCCVKQVLQREHCLHAVTAAYRAVDGEHYTVVWPEGSTNEFEVA